MNAKRIAFDALVDFGARFLVSLSVPPENARLVSESAVLNEAAGVTTHGVAQFFYFEREVGAGIRPDAEPAVVADRPAAALLDGNGAFAQLAVARAVEMIAAKAREFGVGIVCARNTSWVAGLGVKLLPLVKQGFFAQMWAGSSYKYAAPFGGVEPLLGTNPVAFGFPVPGRVPVIADFSTTVISRGRARLMARGGDKAPEKIFLDYRGMPGDDPAVLENGGTIMLLGGESRGYKGFALSLWVEALGIMAGGLYRRDCPMGEHFALVAIDPAAFGEPGEYAGEIARFADLVGKSRPRPGAAVRLPGARSWDSLAESRAKGVPLSGEALASLGRLAARRGIAPLS